MPWDAHRACGSRRSPRTGRWASPCSSPAARRVDRPARLVARRDASTSSSDRSGWRNLYRLVDGPRLEPLRADGGGVRRSRLGVRPLGTTRSCRTARSSPSPAAAAGTASSTSRRATSSARSRAPFTEIEGLQVGPGGIVALAGAPGSATVVVRLDPETLAPAGVLRRSSSLTLDDDGISFPEPIEFPTTGGRTAHALYLPAAQRGRSRARRTSGRRCSSFLHGGPTANASTGLNLVIQLLDEPRLRRARRRLRRLHRLRPRRTAASSRARGASSTWTTASRPRTLLVERGDVDPAPDGDLAAAAPAASRRSRRSRSATGSPPGSATSASADLESLARETHKFESRYLDRLVGPYPEAAERYREPLADLTSSTGSRCPVLVLQGLEDRVVAARPGGGRSSTALAANGDPVRLPRVRGRGPRVPRRGGHPPLARGRAVVLRPGLRLRAGGRDRAGDARRPRVPGGATPAPRPRPSPPRLELGPRRHGRPDRDRARPAPAGRRRRAWPSSPGGIGIPYPIAARARRPRARVRPPRSARPGHRAAARGRVPAVPAADPVRGRLLHADPRLQGEPPRRSACWRSGSSCSPTSSSRSSSTPWCRSSAGGRRSRSGRSSRRPTPWRPPRSSAASACPRRVVTILEGESLINDATALILFRVALHGDRDRHVLPRRGRRARSSSSGSAASLVGVVVGHRCRRCLAADDRRDARDRALAAGAARSRTCRPRRSGCQRRARDRHGRDHRRPEGAPAPCPRTAG